MKTNPLITILLSMFAAGRVASGADDVTAEVRPTNGIVFNFHDVPLIAVLDYLSAKAGLIIVSEVDLKSRVNMVAEQPVSANEIVDLLGPQLAENHYAVALNGHTLTILDAASAKTSATTPVLVDNSGPKQIPINDQVVTEILPVHTLKPGQLVKDLASLIPPGDTVTANEGGHAIIMTASQKDVHRISEIIAALDSSAISDIEVFILKYADAKSVAAELKEIFQSADADFSRSETRNSFDGPGEPGGGPGSPGGGDGGSSDSSTKNAQTHAIFVSDDQMNAIVASGPPDYMHTSRNVIAGLDKPSQDITEIKVFRLKHADPAEIVDELANMFPSSNADSDQNNRSMGFQFDPSQQQPFGDTSRSTRMKRQSSVLAVADRRTESVVVTASGDLMVEIRKVIAALDEGDQGAKHVSAIRFASADPATVQQSLTDLFLSQNASSSSQTRTPLTARAQANANSQSSSTSSSTSGFGTSSSGSSTPR
jgi:type II secretory pathway component GspD/PulD (secretin)